MRSAGLNYMPYDRQNENNKFNSNILLLLKKLDNLCIGLSISNHILLITLMKINFIKL